MLGQSLPNKTLRFETAQAALPQDVVSQRSSRFVWTGIGFAVVVLIGISACATLPQDVSRKPSHLVREVAFSPVMPVLHPGIGRSMALRPASLSPAVLPKQADFRAGGRQQTSARHSRAATSMSAIKSEITGVRSRRYSGSIEIDASMENVWKVITAYERGPEIVPTLKSSRLLPSPDGAILVEQESVAPRGLPGLDERQMTTMRMTESRSPQFAIWTLEAKLESSKMFETLDTKTTLREIAPGRTELAYTLDMTFKKRQIFFKGPQLVLLFDAKIKKETPGNLDGMKRAAEGKIPGFV